MSESCYRPELDGLRAVAILPVLLFHAKMGFPGGYVGVDVFFVISGYLITALILKDISADRFSLIGFWERRIRRLFPALLVVVAASILVAVFVLLPQDFKFVGKSAMSQALMLQNVCFWKHSGYFEGPADLNPLLHTWSLGVEEQFYLLLPLLLLVLRRWSGRPVVITVSILSIVSFALSVYGTCYHPTASFFLLPTRAWELFLGSLLAAVPHRLSGRRWLDETLSWGGLLAIGAAVFLYDDQTRFPGTAALVPCLGTAAIIWSNSPSRTSAGWLLALRPMVGIGLISYSLYLCHWPIFVFAKYWAPADLSLKSRTLLLLASVVLAIVLWKFVETPFRKGWLLPGRPRLFTASGLGLLLLFMVGRVIYMSDGLGQRFPPAAISYAEGRTDRACLDEVSLRSAIAGDFAGRAECTHLPVECLVWGDSHAMAVMPVLNALSRDHSVGCVAATHSSTAPLIGYASMHRFSLGKEAIAFNQAVVDYIRTRRVRNVLLIARWSGYGFRQRSVGHPDEFRTYLEKTTAALRGASANVWIMREIPTQDFDVPKTLARAAIFGPDPKSFGVPICRHRERFKYEDEILNEFVRPGINLLDPTEYLVDETGLCRAEREGKALYCDSHHLSVYGSMQLRPLFESIFRPNTADCK